MEIFFLEKFYVFVSVDRMEYSQFLNSITCLVFRTLHKGRPEVKYIRQGYNKLYMNKSLDESFIVTEFLLINDLERNEGKH